MPATAPSEAALLDEIQQLRTRVASLELERQIPKEIIEKAPVMISIVRAPDFVYELVNPAFRALAPGKEFLGRRFADVWAEIPEPLTDILRNVIASGETFHLEDAPYTIQRGPGTLPELVYVSYSWIPLFGPEGKPDRVLTLAHEVTGAVRERQQLTDLIAELRQAEERFRVLTQNLQSAVALLDENGAFTIVNSSFLRIFDIPQDADILNINNRAWSEWQVFSEDGLLLDVDEHPVRRAALSRTAVKNQLVAVKSPSTSNLKWLLVSAEPILVQGKLHRLICTYYDITELKRAEQALRESEERFRVAQELSPDGFTILRPVRDSDGRVIDFTWVYENSAIAQLNGTDRETVVGRSLLDVLPGHRHSEFLEAYLHVAETGETRVFEAPYLGDSMPSKMWFRTAVIRMGSDIAVLAQDITERKRTEEALRQSLERMEKVLGIQTVGVMFWDLSTGRMVDANDTFLSLMGYSRSEVAAGELNWQTLTPPEYMEVSRAEIEKFLATGRVGPYEKEYFRKDGTRRWLLFAGSSLGGNQCVEFCVDIADRKRAEAALRESEERFRGIVETAEEGIATHDPEGHITYVNQRMADMLGYSREELVGRSNLEFVPDEEREAVIQARESIKEQGSFSKERKLRRKDGSDLWTLVNVSPQWDSAGRYAGHLAMHTDVTRRKAVEAALREREALYYGVFSSVQEAFFIGDIITDASGRPMDYRIIEANRALEIQTGIPLDRFVGNTALTLHPDLDPFWVDTYGRVALTGEPAHFERFVPQHNRHYEVSAYQVRPGRFAALFADVTTRRRNEERLRQTQKLESVGLLAGGVAHDFNNLLTGVMGNASLLLEDAEPEQAEMLRSIIASTERAAHLTRQLLAYAGKGRFIVQPLDVTQAVNEIADLVQFSIPKSAGLSLNLERRLPPVEMDPGQLQQILMNLVINAGEAIGEGHPGRITVTTSMVDVEESFTDELGEEIAPGRYVYIEVRDTGSGIDPEKKAKIFDPFFTTKFVGRGLGLAAIAGILRSHKGGITVESAVGEGSAFKVFLPAAGKAGPAVQEPAPGESRPAVLVVDDEVAVRDFISAVLRRKGYHVIQASDGQEALALCGSALGAIGAAIVDIIMPNMSANDLLHALNAKHPGIKILLTSGYSEAEARRLSAAYPGAEFIQKPYTAQQLARALDALIVAPGS